MALPQRQPHEPIRITAKVKDGRLIVNEPTDLPEGTVLELVEDDPYAYLDEEDELDPEVKAQVDADIEESWADIQAGRTFPIEPLLEKLRQR